jgi:hypothetical protein
LVVVKMPPKITPAAKKAPVKKTPATKAPVKKTPAAKLPATKAPVKRPVPAAVQKKKKTDLGAGLKISENNNVDVAHPAGPPRYGELTQAERAFTLASTFLSGVLAYAYIL